MYGTMKYHNKYICINIIEMTNASKRATENFMRNYDYAW